MEELDNIGLEPTPESEDSDAVTWGKRVSNLLSPKFFYTTVAMCFTIFTMNFLFFGTLFALPKVLVGGAFSGNPVLPLIMGSMASLAGCVTGMFVGVTYTRKMSPRKGFVLKQFCRLFLKLY